MKNSRIIALAGALALSVGAFSQHVAAGWDFEKTQNRQAVELVNRVADTLEGFYETAPGVTGQGIRLDGFTTLVDARGNGRVVKGDALTVEAWVSLGNYPWNWCPVISTISNETKGYRLLIGPLGQASFEVAVGEQWQTCTSENAALPLRTWMHLVGVYQANHSLALYVNGELVSETKLHGRITFPDSGYRMGMVTEPGKPSDIHRTWGTIAQYFGLDGILDEVRIFDQALTAQEVQKRFKAVSPGAPDIAPRKLPVIEKHPGRFGAFYTKLKYYPGWDNLWPVDQDPDIVVTFETSPIKLIFWRGIRYGASWVSENENWMSDQSVEAWGTGENDTEGCFEHMQDRHCRYSHVRIIENTPARVVVHWRYAPTSAYLNTWRVDPKTGWECWIDEYYFIYPDATAIRKVSWKSGTLGYPRQFQETLALLHPGQKISDLLEVDFTLVSDYEGNSTKQSFVDNPAPLDWGDTKDFTIQQYQFKSVNKPFICFEPGNQMVLRDGRLSGYDQAGGCNHFPVGQARCDGRTTRTGDRPSHATSFPISDPVIHEEGGRMWWNGLYGMNGMELSELRKFGRSWAYAAELTADQDLEVLGYDRSERCYQLNLKSSQPAEVITLSLNGSDETPVYHPAFYIRSWNSDEKPQVYVDGKLLSESSVGLKYELEGTDLIVFIPLISRSKTTIELRN